MIFDPSDINNLLLAFIVAAMFVVAGGFFAVMLRLALRRDSKAMMAGAGFGYAALVGFVAVILSWADDLRSPWLVTLVALIFLGHWFMPQAILRLCAGMVERKEGKQ